MFCAFSYLAPLLTDVAGLGSGWVPWILGLFGVGALIGTMIGGRVADAHLFGVLLSGITASTVFLVALALFASGQVAVVALVLPAGPVRLLHGTGAERPDVQRGRGRPGLAGATTTAAFNLGNTSGPWLGGTVIDLDFGFASTAWAGAAMTALALAAVGVALRLQRGGEGGAGGSRSRSRSRLIAKSAAAGGTEADGPTPAPGALRPPQSGGREPPDQFLRADLQGPGPYRVRVVRLRYVVVVALEGARRAADRGGEGVQLLERDIAHQV